MYLLAIANSLSLTISFKAVTEVCPKVRRASHDETLERLFQESKRMIVGKIEKGFRTFEMNRATGLATDNSKTGISYFLFQKL